MENKKIFCFNVLMIFLLAACSNSALTQPAIPTAPVKEISPTKTIEVSTIVPTSVPTLVATETQPQSTATTQPTAKPSELTSGTQKISEKDQMAQVYIPAGEFTMGSNDPDSKITWTGGRAAPEIPVNKVTLDSYWMDKFEVTTGQYATCVTAGGCKPPHLTKYYIGPNYYGNPEFSNYPVIFVDWYMATAYCKWAGRRLPTEAEWEKAARGTDGRKYPWGNEPISGDRANFCDVNCPKTFANPNYDDGYKVTAPVGSYPKGASPYGVMDMAGNVWEWTSTIIMAYPYSATDGREDPNMRAERVWRGGTWSDGTWWLHSALRYRAVQTYFYGNLGFRCASTK